MVVVLSSEQVTGLEANKNNKFMEEAENNKAKCENHNKSLAFLTDQFVMEECEQELSKIEANRAADEEFEAYYLGIPYSPKKKFDDDNRKPIRAPLMTMATYCSTSSSRTSENLESIITTTDNVDDGFFLDYVTIPRRKRSWRKDLGLVIDNQERQAQHDLVVHEQQNYQMNKKNDKHNKRKERQSLQSPQLPVHKKVKRTNIIDKEDSLLPGPEPEMPAHIRDSITRLGGTPPVWLAQKELTASDLSQHLMRLFIPKNTPLATYMTKEEKASFSKVKNLVPMIDPSGNLTQIHLRIWTCLNQQPVFTSNTWKGFMKAFNLRAHSDTLQIWCFRLPAERGSELCFAVNLIRKQPSLRIV